MERLDDETQRAVRRFLDLIADRYSVAGAVVYGSRARGTHRPDSDADLAVILRGARQRRLPVKLDMADSAYDILLETGVLVSPLPVWQDEWEEPDGALNPALLANIKREGVLL